jgi:hypothetical protein
MNRGPDGNFRTARVGTDYAGAAPIVFRAGTPWYRAGGR